MLPTYEFYGFLEKKEILGYKEGIIKQDEVITADFKI